MDGHTESQCETIKPRHYRVAGYKNYLWSMKHCREQQEAKSCTVLGCADQYNIFQTT